jgi:hypothetical protein
MARVCAASITSNSSLVGSKRVANQSPQPEIYYLFFVRLSAGVHCLPEDGKRTVADLSQPLANFGQLGGSLAIPENTRFRVQSRPYGPPPSLERKGPQFAAWLSTTLTSRYFLCLGFHPPS